MRKKLGLAESRCGNGTLVYMPTHHTFCHPSVGLGPFLDFAFPDRTWLWSKVYAEMTVVDEDLAAIDEQTLPRRTNQPPLPAQLQTNKHSTPIDSELCVSRLLLPGSGWP
jgi:hypothetical protein